MTEAKSITLFCTEGASDKQYDLRIEPKDGGFVVNFAFGRRGSALKQGTKTQTPVNYEAANKIYTKLLGEKQAKGYTESETGQRYVGTELAGRDSGLTPQLPTAIAPHDVKILETSDDWIAQEKFDGENRMITIEADTVGGVNRRGLTVPVPETWSASDLPSNNGRTVVCGEHMGPELVAFDIVEHDGECLRSLNYLSRHMRLTEVAGHAPWIRIAPIAVTAVEKAALRALVQEQDGEGIVYKKANASFDGGRSLNAYKHKFQESSTFVVTRVNDQRSVALALHDNDGQLVPMGNVTVPANHVVPMVGAFVEVEYMYRYEGGALMQPKYKGERTDLEGPMSIKQIQRIKAKAA